MTDNNTPNTTRQENPTQPEGNGHAGKMFTQEEVNNIVRERLNRVKAGAAEQDERATALDEREAAVQQREQAMQQKESRAACEDHCKAKGYDTAFLDLLDTSDPERFTALLDKLYETAAADLKAQQEAEQATQAEQSAAQRLEHINRAVLGEHSCIEITEEGKRVRKSANLLNSCTSLDVHLDIDDENTTVRSDLIEDPAASQAFQNVEDNNYTEKLHNDLEKAIDTLPRRQADIIRRHYFAETPLADIAREDGISSSAVHTSERAALYTLSKNRTLLRWHDEIISERAWNGTGFCAWKSHGSVQERTVEYLEEQMPKMERELEERRAFLERMIQLAPEHREAIESTSLYKDAFKNVVNSVV